MAKEETEVKGSPWMINRKQYKEIKAYDHQQMEQFCKGMYDKGFQDGYKEGEGEAQGIDEDSLLRILMGVKGIGERRAREVVASLRTAAMGKKCFVKPAQESRGNG